MRKEKKIKSTNNSLKTNEFCFMYGAEKFSRLNPASIRAIGSQPNSYSHSIEAEDTMRKYARIVYYIEQSDSK